MIKICLLDPMTYTPFWRQECIRQMADSGILITKNSREADLFITRFTPKYYELLHWWRLTLTKKMKILVWTHEPRFVTRETTYKLKIPSVEVNFMNLYTQDVFTDNYGFSHFMRKPLPALSEQDLADKTGYLVAMVSFIKSKRRQALWKYEKNIDLGERRQELLLDGYRKSKLHIHGKNWPNNIARTNSRNKPEWANEKVELIKPYKYCVAIENTDWPYYVTEKIWQALSGGCVPVYGGSQGTIYEDFEPDTFIDIDNYKSSGELFEHLDSIDNKEFLHRYNSCVKTYNAICDKIDIHTHPHVSMTKRIIEKIHEIVQ